MAADFAITVTDAPDPGATAVIAEGLGAYNDSQGGVRDFRPIAVLVAEVPAVFGGQGLGNTNGKTRILAPVGAAMMFTGTPQAVLIKEVTDGTSNTIFLVEATPDHAVIWTRPDDLKIDAKQPTAGLLDERATGFNAVFADGSVHYLSAKIDAKTLNALLTRNGGEVIKSNEW